MEFYTNIQISRDNILVRGIRDGETFKEKVPYKPSLFVKSKHNKPTEFKNLKGEYLSEIKFDSITDAKNFLHKYEGMADTFPIFGYGRHIYNYIDDYYADQEPVIDDVSIVYFDIEVGHNHYEPTHMVRLEDNTVTTISDLRFYEGKKVWDETKSIYVDIPKSSYMKPNGFPSPDKAANPITAISLRKNDDIYVLTTVKYEAHRDDVIHIPCKNEVDLINKFLALWKNLAPDIVSGWNSQNYDIPYIVNRITKVVGEQAAKRLSPWGIIREFTKEGKYGKELHGYNLIGIASIDLMEAYIKFSFKNHESFSLNYISHVELGEKKIDYSEYESLFDLYLKDPQKFIEYNIQDTDLVYKINQKTGLIPQIIELAYSAGVNYEDAFTSVLFWEVKIKNKLRKDNIIIPANKERVEKTRKNMGAYVKPPIPGKYKWVVYIDADSLYPSSIIQYNISPETIVEHHDELLYLMPIEDVINGKLLNNELIKTNIKEKNYAYTINGSFFRKNIRGIIPQMMIEEYALRKDYKQKMLQSKKELNEIEIELEKRNIK